MYSIFLSILYMIQFFFLQSTLNMSDSEESNQVTQASPSEFSAPRKVSDKKLEALAKARAKKQEVVKRARVEKREGMLKNISDDYKHEVDHLVNERMAIERQKLDTEFAQWKVAFYEQQGQGQDAKLRKQPKKITFPNYCWILRDCVFFSALW
ncbi:hypothetical protein DFS34DRAFT_618388 [Phlyctochytrium arcticum]|nr:hypothetical protein DFS34DRAFT_618388 [Phlyctochytrium arcticum]